MDRSDQYKGWEKDFGEFLNAPEINPPAELSRKIFDCVSTDLNPSPWKVFTKLIGVVVIAGSASLLICPQLGLSSYYSPLMSFFMKLGPVGCRAACGAFFMMVSILCACIVMRPEELRVLRRTKFLSISAVSALALGAFVCATPDVILSVALTWLVGASLGGILTLEAGYWLKMLLMRNRSLSTI